MSNVNQTGDPVYDKLLSDGWSWVSSGRYGDIHWAGAVNYYDQLPTGPKEGDAYTVKYKGSSASGGTEIDGTEYVWGKDVQSEQLSWIAFGPSIPTNVSAFINDIGYISRSNETIHDANEFTTTGYIKTYKDWTENLPSEVYNTDSEWGVLFFVAENTEELTGTQIFYPIDGPYKGRMFTRSLVHMSYEEPSVGAWMLLAVTSDIPKKMSDLTNDSDFVSLY